MRVYRALNCVLNFNVYVSLYVCMTANIWCRQCAEREKVRHANTQPLTHTHTPFVVVLNSKN